MASKARILRLAKGFRGRSNSCISIARERVEKALQYAYRDRKNKKRDMRRLWITRINAGSREYGVRYSDFVRGLGAQQVELNRKMLSELAVNEPHSFKAYVR